jgi:pimeloyl-ACP methyl ester carboxylesterase
MTVISNTGLQATQFKTIDGLKIRFAVNEKQDGDPILLLSPLPESILAFLPTWEIFSALGPLVAVDLPPFGLSESRSGARTPETAAEFPFLRLQRTPTQCSDVDVRRSILSM